MNSFMAINDAGSAPQYVEQKAFFKALPFLAVTLKGEDSDARPVTDKIVRLTGLLEEFCREIEAGG
mgnify:CR=1 FL=1